MRPWLPLALAVAAFASAAVFGSTESEAAGRAAGALFGVLLGAALLAWAGEEVGQGRIRARSRHVHRASHPRLFYMLLGLKRLLPGLVMVATGLWYGVSGGP